ncbi:LysR family transcriptional regulator [Embleya scabrispora]|uniref:LysR family transcriptional regulator n=1 Tax=Embleya scabrispora TaxID=159449 RepID=UPI00037419FD|nr:LysR family transcriptional regulator [Embleya scabrispora]MYS86063.1 LysR family transcriptional regulator [Streptomyces sp. SID5474]
MELRDIEIFLALAEELHFGRTAERLRISQARVSQAIKKQERRIGAPLFERTSRSVTLTPVGQVLRGELQQAYDLINSGLARASDAAAGVAGVLRLGVMGVLGNEMRPVIDAFRTRYPGCDVEVVEYHFGAPFSRLRTGAVDLQLMWLPIHEPDLTVGPVTLTEGRVLAVATGSAPAGRNGVSLEDLGDVTVFDPGPDVPDYWFEAMVPRRTPGGRRIARGPAGRTFHEILALIAAGRAVSPVNAHVRRYYTPPGITFLPIHDAPPTEWALVWATAGDNARIRAFARTARSLGTRAIEDGTPAQPAEPRPAG